MYKVSLHTSPDSPVVPLTPEHYAATEVSTKHHFETEVEARDAFDTPGEHFAAAHIALATYVVLTWEYAVLDLADEMLDLRRVGGNP
jgi:hypothetical protein